MTAPTAFNRSEIIKFPAVDTNKGNGYSASTGKFKAPADGSYSFSVMVTATSGNYTTWYLKSSKDKVYVMVVAQALRGSATATGNAVIELAKNDEVFVVQHDATGNNAGPTTSVRCDTHTCPTFSGFFIA